MNFKKIMSNNPVARLRRKRMRKALKNDNITFFTPNCIGGILFHDLGLRFCSPTVNLMMRSNDFVAFVNNLDAYLNGEFTEFKHEEYTCPCAHLSAKGCRDIDIHFTHYKTFNEAVEKWNERAKRIDKDNTFIFVTERDGLTKEEIESLKNLDVKGIVAFTANDYPEIPYGVFIKKYAQSGEVGNILKKNYLTDAREYEKYFDFVKWFNNASGKKYDVTPFTKKQP